MEIVVDRYLFNERPSGWTKRLFAVEKLKTKKKINFNLWFNIFCWIFMFHLWILFLFRWKKRDNAYKTNVMVYLKRQQMRVFLFQENLCVSKLKMFDRVIWHGRTTNRIRWMAKKQIECEYAHACQFLANLWWQQQNIQSEKVTEKKTIRDERLISKNEIFHFVEYFMHCLPQNDTALLWCFMVQLISVKHACPSIFTFWIFIRKCVAIGKRTPCIDRMATRCGKMSCRRGKKNFEWNMWVMRAQISFAHMPITVICAMWKMKNANECVCWVQTHASDVLACICDGILSQKQFLWLSKFSSRLSDDANRVD